MKVPTKVAVEKVMQDHLPADRAYMFGLGADSFVTNLSCVRAPVFAVGDRRSLAGIRDAVSKLQYHLATLSDALGEHLDGLILVDPECRDMIIDVERIEKHVEALGRAVNHPTFNDAPMQIRRSDFNIGGVEVVHAARWAWHSVCAGVPPISGLRDGDAFAGFLADLLTLCEVDGDARSIFAAWAQLQGDFS